MPHDQYFSCIFFVLGVSGRAVCVRRPFPLASGDMFRQDDETNFYVNQSLMELVDL